MSIRNHHLEPGHTPPDRKTPFDALLPCENKKVKKLLTVDGDGALLSSRRWSHGLNLPNEKALFVCELVIVGSILQEFWQKVQESLPVVHEDPLHSYGFMGVCNEHLHLRSQ